MSNPIKMNVAYNGTTLEVLWGINTILRYDPHAKIRATNGCIYFGAYSSRDLMTENEQIDMESWGWTSGERGSKAEWVRRV